MYEDKTTPPLPRAAFLRRVVFHLVVAVATLFGSLGLGMFGYHHFERLSWLDSFLNAAMLLGGMGPVNQMKTDGGKLFAGIFALYAGMVFLAVVAFVLTPILHRVLHKFHWDQRR